MPAPLIDDDEEPYASSEDSDFAPDTGAAPDDSASEDDDKTRPAADDNVKPSKAPAQGNGAEDAGYDNSGDEAIIRKGARKRRKGKAGGEDIDDEGGEGGLVKTRRQRAAEKEERKIAATKGPVTIDVDTVWAQMLAGQPAVPSGGGDGRLPEDLPHSGDAEGDADTQAAAATVAAATPIDKHSGLVRIRRTYNFAGQVHTEEKLVAHDSAEAKLFIASGGQVEPATTDDNDGDADRLRSAVARKAFRSSFEPQLDATSQTRRSDLDLGVAARTKAAREAQAKKLNTVEKSRMDWAGFVDKEGIKDELELAGRSKDSYVVRQDFLDRSEMRRELDARQARMSGKT